MKFKLGKSVVEALKLISVTNRLYHLSWGVVSIGIVWAFSALLAAIRWW